MSYYILSTPSKIDFLNLLEDFPFFPCFLKPIIVWCYLSKFDRWPSSWTVFINLQTLTYVTFYLKNNFLFDFLNFIRQIEAHEGS